MNATLEATMRLEISQLQSALAKSDAAVAKFKNNLKTQGSGFGKALFGDLNKHLGGLLPAMGVAAVAGGFKSITNSMDDLADTALRLNESTEMIQRVTHASEILAGVNAEGLTGSFLKLEKALGDLDNEAATKALADLGITAEKLAAAPLDEKILMMSEAFQTARATGTGYNDILDLLGKSAGSLIPMFMQTRETITGLFDDAHIVPDEEVQRLAALNDQIDGFLANLKSYGTGIAASIVGWTQSIGEGLGRGIGLSYAAFNTLLETGSLDKAREQAFAIMNERQSQLDQEANDKLNAGTQRGSPGERAASKEAATASAKAAKQEEAQNERIGKKAVELAQLQRDMSMERLPLEGRIAALQERMAEAKAMEAKAAVFQDTEGRLDAEKQRLEIQRDLNRLMLEQGQASKDAAEEIAKMAEDERQQAQEAAKVTAERKKQGAQRQADRENIMMDLEVLRLRARGNDKAADKLERDKRIATEAAQIIKDTGASEKQALALAKERADLEDKLERRRNGEAGHIGGVKKKGYMSGSDPNTTATALDEFKNNQRKRPLQPGEKPPPGYGPGDMVPVNYDGLSGRGPRRGRMMGGDDQGSISYRATAAAGAQDAREKQDTSGRDIGNRILAILQTLVG